MATGRKNNKSIQVSVRVPLEDYTEIEQLKNEEESIAGFIVQATQNEIKRRRKKAGKKE